MASTKRRTKRSRGMTVVHPNAAGVDIGARFHVAAVRSRDVDEPVRTFQTFTNDLQRLADWFEEAGVETADALAGHVEPVVQQRVVGNELLDHLVGAVDVLRVARQSGPAEGSLAAAEQGANIGLLDPVLSKLPDALSMQRCGARPQLPARIAPEVVDTNMRQINLRE